MKSINNENCKFNEKKDYDRFLAKIRDLRETIESGTLCITDLFQNKS